MTGADARRGAAGTGENLDVVAVGSAIVDILVEVDPSELTRLGISPGTMTLVDAAESESLYRSVRPAKQVSGGSAANTVVGVAALGGAAGFVGRTGADDLGTLFRDDLMASGVVVGQTRSEVSPARDDRDAATGRCVVLVTPDGERTMVTHLGAASLLGPQDLDPTMVGSAGVVYLEGYLWDAGSAKAALRQAMDLAHGADGLVALSLSDRLCVDRHRAEFLNLVADQVDVLFANEDEARALFGAAGTDAAVVAAQDTGILVVITRGAAGSTVVTPSGAVTVAATPVDAVVDTTGAGDLFAAGFLFGLTHGADPDQCAVLGGACAAEVIAHLGARPRTDLARLVPLVDGWSTHEPSVPPGSPQT